MPSTELKMTKVTATGNDFLIINLLDASVAQIWSIWEQKASRATWAKRFCNRHFGIGADGLVLLEKETNLDFKWDFYNSDGSLAEMCGNAARAVALFMKKNGIDQQILKWKTLAGPIQAEVLADRVDISMPEIKLADFNRSFLFDGQNYNYTFLDTGVPHAVFHMNKPLVADQLRSLAKAVRQHQTFQPKGTNVTFVFAESTKIISSFTFERGVEDFTLSCGTGAVAAAYTQFKLTKTGEIEVKVPGGRLAVNFNRPHPHLIGPAQIITQCSLSSWPVELE